MRTESQPTDKSHETRRRTAWVLVIFYAALAAGIAISWWPSA